MVPFDGTFQGYLACGDTFRGYLFRATFKGTILGVPWVITFERKLLGNFRGTFGVTFGVTYDDTFCGTLSKWYLRLRVALATEAAPKFGTHFSFPFVYYRLGSRFRVKETSQISEHYIVQMKAAIAFHEAKKN